MKHNPEQLILAAHIRALALDFWRLERNAMRDKWHLENPGNERPMDEFADELNKKHKFRHFILEASAELSRIVDVINLPPEEPQPQETTVPPAAE